MVIFLQKDRNFVFLRISRERHAQSGMIAILQCSFGSGENNEHHIKIT